MQRTLIIGSETTTICFSKRHSSSTIMGKSAAKRRKKKALAAENAGASAADGSDQHEDAAQEVPGMSEAAESPPTSDQQTTDPPSYAPVALEAQTDSDPQAEPEANHDADPPQREQDGLTDEQQFVTPADVKRVLQRFFTVLLMANLSPHSALKPLCGQPVRVDDIERALQDSGWESKLLPIESAAILSSAADGKAVDAQKLFDLAGAAAFKVELCEFQIRAQMRAKTTGKASRGKVDVQRIISRLVAGHLAPDAQVVTSAQFESLLEQKLGLATGKWLANVVFARVIRRPFQRSFPPVLEACRLAFIEAMERFCVLAQFSLECVEGQIRELANKHTDLRKAFEAMDSDNSGAISADELIAFLRQEAHMDFPADVLRAFIERFDTDGNGMLDYREFVDFVRPKQFGIQVLSPFGLSYLPLDRLAMMKEVVETVRTRMFWLQHNDLLAKTAADARKPRTRASASRGGATDKQQNAPTKLKVTEQFQLTRHFGTLPLVFDDKAAVASVLDNGELVVLVSADSSATTTTNSSELLRMHRPQAVPEFEYRPSVKRSIPPLFAHATLLKSEPH